MVAVRLDRDQHGYGEQRSPDAHTKLQKMSPMKMATSFVRAVRLVSQGVSSHPSMLVMTSEIPAT